MNEQQVFEAVFKATGVQDFEKAIAGAQESIKSFENASGKIKDTGKTLTKRVTAPLAALGGVAMAVGSQYETSMSSVQAISGSTADEMEVLESVAREMGATTRYSASESADALGYMALAGWDVEQMTSALPDVLNLATAGQLDLAKASDIVTDMMSMFGMEANEASRASDVFAAAQSNSNTNVEQLSEALINAGPAAAAVGYELEETSAVLGIFANNGIKGGRAGTILNAMLRDVQASAEDGAVAIGETSVAVYDAEGNMRAMGDIMADVERATAGMSDEQRNAALSAVFQQESIRGANILLGEGMDALTDLEISLYEAGGAAQDMADIMDDNMEGSLLSMKSAAEEVAIQFFEMAEGPIRAIVDGITDMIRWFGELDPAIQQVIGIVGVLVAAIGPLLMLIGQMGLGVSALGTFFVGTAGSTSMFATIIGALTGPVTLVIGAIAALIGVLVYLYNTNEQFAEIVEVVWIRIQMLFETVIQIISDILMTTFETLSTWWSENQERFWAVVSTVWGAISEFFISVFTAIADIIWAIWRPLSEWYQKNQEAIQQTVEIVWNKIANTFMTIMEVIGSVVEWGFNFMSSIIDRVMPYIQTIIDNSMQIILNVISLVMGIIRGDWEAVWNSIKNILESTWEIIQNVIQGAIEGVKTIISDGIRAAYDTIMGWKDRFFNAGKNIVNSIADGIRGAIGAVTGAIDNVVSKVRNFLPFSPAKEGPLKDLNKLNFGGTIADSIYDGENTIQRAMNQALNMDMGVMNGRVTHELNNNLSTQPAFINVNIGGQNFRGFVENISNEQGRITDLELQF